jgi:hypothetical protein
MNAGIADAMNLSWKLAGVLNGWAQPAILDAYELERQPVTEQVSRYAMNTSFTRESLGSSLPHNLEEFGPEGDAVRARIGKSAYEQNVGQFCCGGLNFGYFYKNSPIIAYDGEPRATRSTTSSSPRFRAAARRMYGCAAGDHCMTLWGLSSHFCEPILRLRRAVFWRQLHSVECQWLCSTWA